MSINFLKKLISILLLTTIITTALQADVVTVTSNANNGIGTLRDAIMNADNGDVINFQAGLAPIILAAEIEIEKNITIIGAVEISGGEATRIFIIPEGKAVTIEGITLKDGNADNGGAIHNSGELHLRGVTLTANTATGNGGAVFNQGELSTDNDTHFLRNAAANGGAIYSIGQLTTQKTAILSNIAQNNGGGIYTTGISTIQSNTLISRDTAQIGGGVYNTGNLLIKRSVVLENYATMTGGGIYNTDYLTIEEGSLVGENQANLAGGIFTSGICSIHKSSVATNNSLTDAGGIMNGGTLNLRDSSQVFLNNAQNNGGGIFNQSDSLDIRETCIRTNKAGADGGGIYNAAYLYIADSEVSKNNATSNGGGIYNEDKFAIYNSEILYNKAYKGGGIYNTDTSEVNETDIRGNSTEVDGGGIYNTDSMEIWRSWVQFNTAKASHGGGIYNTSILTLTDCSDLIGNTAFVDGGGLYNCGTAMLRDINILDNNAKRNGGGIFTKVFLVLERSTLARNFAMNGGGIYNQAPGEMEIENSTFSSNGATGKGGALYDSGNSSGLNNNTFTLNIAANGGGISKQPGGLGLRMESNIVASNTSLNVGTDIENAGTIFTLGKNFIGANDGCAVIFPKSPSPIIPNGNGDYVGLPTNPYNPMLHPLAENAAWSLVHIPKHCSPVIDRGSNPLDLETDQRSDGFERVRGSQTDIGAIEVQDPHEENPPLSLIPDQHICPDEYADDILLDGEPDVFYNVTGLTGTISDLPAGTVLTHADLVAIGLDNAVSGAYTFTVQVNGFGECDSQSGNVDFDIVVHNAPIITTTPVNPTCDSLDGQIIVVADGGTPPYNYSIDGGAIFSPSDIFIGLPPGDYNVVVRDENGCLSNVETATLTDDCTPLPDYCAAQGQDTSKAWIEHVGFCDINNTSGNDGGYGNHTAMVAEVAAGQTQQIVLTPQFSSFNIDVRWYVWIDFNQDGTFGFNELVVKSPYSSTPVSATVHIPSDAVAGPTGMRVKMVIGKSLLVNPCGNFRRGEVEDYTVNISGNNGLVVAPATQQKRNLPNINLAIKIFPNPVREQATIEFELTDDSPVTLVVADAKGRPITTLIDNERLSEGIHQATFDGSDLPTGMYYCTLQVNNTIRVEPISLAK